MSKKMNVLLNTLETFLIKATCRTLSKPDEGAVKAFCAAMLEAPEGPILGAQVLAARMHSLVPREAMLTLEMLDRCVRYGSQRFQIEIGKFRFLNEMIKLVSPKYFANRTAPEVREKVILLLRSWAFTYKKDSKYSVAYDMLKSQGVIDESTLPPMTIADYNRDNKSSIFDDEEKSKLLARLLHSNKQEDLQHANRLIKSMVREDERITEEKNRREQEMSAALDSAGLLRDMLNRAEDASEDEQQLMKELAVNCVRQERNLRNLLKTEIPDEPDCDLSEIHNACSTLEEAYVDYQMFLSDLMERNAAAKADDDEPSLLDFAAPTPDTSGAAKNTIEELTDIFSTGSTPPVIDGVLEPVSVVNTSVSETKESTEEKPKAEGWNELDNIGQNLLKMSLPENAKRADGFNSPKPKIPMNALEKSTMSSTNNNDVLDLDFFTKDDELVDITMPKKGKDKTDIKPLSNIKVSIDNITPGKTPSRTAYEEEDGISVVFHFCKDMPREDVNVIVVSTTNKSKSPIEGFKFQVAVSKGCKVRLLEASGSRLPSYSPFLPQSAITQIMLVGVPESIKAVTFKFIITYLCDRESYSEMGEIVDLSVEDMSK